MRGADSDPFLHVTHKGAPGFAGVAFKAPQRRRSPEARDRENDAKVEALDGPGGGHRVRLNDPDGFAVEVVAGRDAGGAVLPLPSASPTNDARVQAAQQCDQSAWAAAPRMSSGSATACSTSRTSAPAKPGTKSASASSPPTRSRSSPEFALGAFLRCDRGDSPPTTTRSSSLGTGTRKVQPRRLRGRRLGRSDGRSRPI